VLVALQVSRNARLFAVLVSFIVLFTIFEQPMMTGAAILMDFVLVPRMSYFSLPLARLVAVLVGLLMYCALLNSFVRFVLAHCESSMHGVGMLATLVPLMREALSPACCRHANI
jgi:hypothetical protein